MAGDTTSDMMIKEAYLLGQVGNALFQKDGRYFVISIEDKDPVPCHGREISLLSDVTSEYSLFTSESGITLKELRKRLRNLYYAYKALSFSLNGLDPAMEKSRGAVIQTANKLCQRDDKIYQFVRNRLLGYPFPLHNENEANKAIESANSEAVKVKADRVGGIYEELSENWKRLQTFHEIWQAVVPKFFVDETERARALRFFVDKGFVSGLVTTNSSIDDLQKTVSEKPTEFDGIFEELPREILGRLLTESAEKLKDVASANHKPQERIDTLFINKRPEGNVAESFIIVETDKIQTHWEDFSYCNKVVILWDENAPDYSRELISFSRRIRIQCHNDVPILVWGVPTHRQQELSPLTTGQQKILICDKLDNCRRLSG